MSRVSQINVQHSLVSHKNAEKAKVKHKSENMKNLWYFFKHRKQIISLLTQWVEFGNQRLFAPPQIESEELLTKLGVEFKGHPESK